MGIHASLSLTEFQIHILQITECILIQIQIAILLPPGTSSLLLQ